MAGHQFSYTTLDLFFEDLQKNEPKKGDTFRHFRTGNLYKVLEVGLNEDSMEAVVIYSPVDHPAHVWMRTIKNFMEPIAIGVNRFTKVPS